MATVEQEIHDLVYKNPPQIGRPSKDDEFGILMLVEVPEAAGGPSEKTIRETEARMERNAHLGLTHFGFGSSFCPTLQELADQVEGLETRERARQILNRFIFDHIDNKPQPVASKIAEIIESRPFWSEADLIETLQEASLVDDVSYLHGLMDYLHRQGLSKQWEVVRPDLSPPTRGNYYDLGSCFVVEKELRKTLSKALKKARRIAPLNGLCRIKHVGLEIEHAAPLVALLAAHSDVWLTEHDDGIWYLFEGRHNTLLGYAGKLFSLVDTCDIDKLSEILGNALDARTSRFKEYPDRALIKKWIQRSDNFSVHGQNVSLARESDRKSAHDLNPAEVDLITLLQGQGARKATDVENQLRNMGHSGPTTAKRVRNSPLAFLDRAPGRGKFTVTLVTDLEAPHEQLSDDYNKFKNRLEDLHKTDKRLDGVAREEQRILSDWIFRGKTHERCAICDQEFARGALITAHKKKRSLCTETERRDPHIVFPLCVFGCDYLYERDFIRIINGRVSPGKQPTGETEAQRIHQLLGRILDDRWLEGPSDYFDIKGRLTLGEVSSAEHEAALPSAERAA